MKHRLLLFLTAVALIFCTASALAAEANTLNLPDDLKIIEEEAFCGSMSIGRVILPDGITEIRSRAFADSTVTEIYLPESLSYIADDAFAQVSGLICYGKTGSYAEQWADSHKYTFISSELRSGSIGSNIQWTLQYGHLVIEGTGSIPNYQYPKSGEAPWYEYRDEIIHITVGEGITSVGNYNFCHEENLLSVQFPSSLKSLGGGVFAGCFSLKSAVIPDSVTSMSWDVFYNCTSLEYVSLSTNLKSISTYVFYNTLSLRELYIPSGITSIASSAFKQHSPDLIIYGESGSAAQSFATRNYIPFRAQSGKTVTFRSFFSASPYLENERLITESALLSRMVYDGANGPLIDQAIAKELISLGFYSDTIIGYNYNSGEHTVGVVFAMQYLDDVPLYAIILRGTRGMNELISDVIVGHSLVHEGFTLAAIDVYDIFETTYKPVLQSHGYDVSSSEPFLWITGHSRGAAVGNILASNQFDQIESRTYAYLFATPNTTKVFKTKPNIFNYIFEGDLVPQVPLGAWGFTKNGRTKTIVDSNWGDNAETINKEQMGNVVRMLTTLVPSHDIFYNELQTDLEELLNMGVEDAVAACLEHIVKQYVSSRWSIVGKLTTLQQAIEIEKKVVSFATACDYFDVDLSAAELASFVGDAHNSLNYYIWTLRNYPELN